jgi:hypothetical protein
MDLGEQNRALLTAARQISAWIEDHLSSPSERVIDADKFAVESSISVDISTPNTFTDGTPACFSAARFVVSAVPPPEEYKPRGRLLRHLQVPEALMARAPTLEKLKAVLLRGSDSGRATCLTAAAGMGGLGKTVLAALAMEDPEVQERFSDGIIGVTIGNSPDKDHLLREIGAIAEALGVSKRGWTRENARDRIGRLFENKAVLLVIDDIWSAADVDWRPRIGKGNSAILFTTRQQDLYLSITGTEMVEVDFLTKEEARALLAFHAKVDVEDLPPDVNEILQHCGLRENKEDSRVPAFAVCIAGKMVSTPTGNWGAVLKHFVDSRIDWIVAPSDYSDHKSIYDWIHASVTFLLPEDQERYLKCSILDENEVVEFDDFFILWADYLLEGSDEAAQEQIGHWLQSLHNASLLNWDKRSNVVTFHDLQLDYVKCRASGGRLKR